jgi:AcrR family transcriptional regulator
MPTAEPSGAAAGPAPDRHATGTAVLDAAASLLAERGPGAFSVRAVATRAGHSTISIYHHFGSKQGLIDALYAAGFERLGEIQAPPEDLHDPFEIIWSISMGLRRMALENPSLYRVMFSPALPDLVPSRDAREPARRNYYRYLDAMRDWAAREPLVVVPELAAHILWTAGHGLIMAELAQLSTIDIDGTEAFEKGVLVVLNGLRKP